MNNGNRNFVYIILALSVLLALLSFLVVIIITVIFFTSTESDSSSSKTAYVYSELNPVKQYSSYGFVKLAKNMEDEEYMSYMNKETGNYVLITSFNGDDYECEGSCHCSEERRSSTAAVLTRGLTLLISAVSASLAMKMAQETFQETCRDQFSDNCQTENIVPEDVACFARKETMDDSAIRHHRNQMVKRIQVRHGGEEYDCTGHCLPNLEFRKLFGTRGGKKYTDMLAKILNCEQYEYSRGVRAGRLEMKKGRTPIQMSARFVFSRYLDRFCHRKCNEVLKEHPELKKMTKELRHVVRKRPMCRGSPHFLKRLTMKKVKNIKCVARDPSVGIKGRPENPWD